MKWVSELRRRNVFRMAVLYLVTAWLIMQVAEVVVTLASLPNWTGRIVLTLLVVGFPIALILSWFFELTPAGISLEKDIERHESITHITGRRIDLTAAIHAWRKPIAVITFGLNAPHVVVLKDFRQSHVVSV